MCTNMYHWGNLLGDRLDRKIMETVVTEHYQDRVYYEIWVIGERHISDVGTPCCC